MGSYKDMYYTIENPLTDEVLLKLMSVYGTSYHLYDLLMSVNNDAKHLEKDQKLKDEFYKEMFKRWKRGVLSVSDKEIEEFRRIGKFDSNYYQLKEFLKRTQDIKTQREWLFLLDDNSLVEKYSWDSRGGLVDPNWVEIGNYGLHKGLHMIDFPIEHRLYMSPSGKNTEPLALSFIDKCEKYKIPFYFKFDRRADRDDTFVIYSDTPNLQNYITILKQIKQENPNLFSDMGQPPLLCGKIESWLGYGSEPQETSESFNHIRATIIEDSIKTATEKWLQMHQNDQIRVAGEKMTVAEYLAHKVADRIVNDKKENMDSMDKKGQMQQYYDETGLLPSDFTNGDLKRVIFPSIRSGVSKALENVQNVHNAKMVIQTRNNKRIELAPYNSFYIVFRQMTKEIATNDKTFLPAVKADILRKAKQAGIDTNKFCFDVVNRDQLFKSDAMMDIVTRCLEPLTKQWLQTNQDRLIMVDGQEITISEYLARKVTDNIISAELQHKEHKYHDQNQKYYEQTGLLPRDFTQGNLKDTLLPMIRAQVPLSLNNMEDIRNNVCNIQARNNKNNILYPYEFFYVTFRQMTKEIVRHDKKFSSIVVNDLQRRLTEAGINANEFDVGLMDSYVNLELPEVAIIPQEEMNLKSSELKSSSKRR